MRAITVLPLTPASAEIGEVDEPEEADGEVLVETMAVGICGTDIEIVRGDYGWAPPGRQRLVLGHESLGRVTDAPPGSSVQKGDLVVGIVRRPDPVPCPACAAGEWDACRNGRYVEHGIKELDGFLRERYRAKADALVTVDAKLAHLGVLLEPTTIVAKAWDQTLAIGNRAIFEPERALVVGAGPIGLLAAMIGRQKGLDVHVVDQVTSGAKPDLVRALGATYHTGAPAEAVKDADVVIECTGVPSVITSAIEACGIGGVVCLTGISPTGTESSLDLGAIARAMVLGNRAIFGSVNANRSHYEQGAAALAAADDGWLERLISRSVPMEKFTDALERHPDDVKVVVRVSK